MAEFPKQNLFVSRSIARIIETEGSLQVCGSVFDPLIGLRRPNRDFLGSRSTYRCKLLACLVVLKRYRACFAACCSSSGRLSIPAGNLAPAARNDLSRNQDRSGCCARPGALSTACNLNR